MGQAPIACRRHVDLAWIGLGVGDQLGNSFGRNRWMHHHDEAVAADACDWRDIANKIETELLVECRVDCARRSDQEEHIAVRGRLDDNLRADIAAPTRPIFDDELLTKSLR